MCTRACLDDTVTAPRGKSAPLCTRSSSSGTGYKNELFMNMYCLPVNIVLQVDKHCICRSVNPLKEHILFVTEQRAMSEFQFNLCEWRIYLSLGSVWRVLSASGRSPQCPERWRLSCYHWRVHWTRARQSRTTASIATGEERERQKHKHGQGETGDSETESDFQAA